MQCSEKQPDSDADRFLRVICRLCLAVIFDRVDAKDDNKVRRDLEERLVLVGTENSKPPEPFLTHPPMITECLLPFGGLAYPPLHLLIAYDHKSPRLHVGTRGSRAGRGDRFL